jgi:hypothetical protein
MPESSGPACPFLLFAPLAVLFYIYTSIQLICSFEGFSQSVTFESLLGYLQSEKHSKLHLCMAGESRGYIPIHDGPQAHTSRRDLPRRKTPCARSSATLLPNSEVHHSLYSGSFFLDSVSIIEYTEPIHESPCNAFHHNAIEYDSWALHIHAAISYMRAHHASQHLQPRNASFDRSPARRRPARARF